MKRWPRKKLVDIAAVQMGQSPPGESYNLDGVGLPFFQGKAEFGKEYPTTVKWCNQPSRIADAGDILLSVRAPVGPTNFAPERCCIGRGLAAIRAEPKACHPRYVRYYLKRFETEIAARGVGSTFNAINRNDIERLEVPVPPLGEQERIVKLLDEADELRKLRAQADRRTAALIPALFHEMFGDPVINTQKWKREILESLLDKIDGGWSPTCHDRQAKENEWGVLKLGAVTTCGYIDSENKALPEDSLPRTALEIKVGDLLFTRKNTFELVAACAYVFETRPKLMLSDLIFRLQLKPGVQIDPLFLWGLLTRAC